MRQWRRDSPALRTIVGFFDRYRFVDAYELASGREAFTNRPISRGEVILGAVTQGVARVAKLAKAAKGGRGCGSRPRPTRGGPSTPLTRSQKDNVRYRATLIWERRMGQRASKMTPPVQVHHRIPLEWAHLMPGSPQSRGESDRRRQADARRDL
jgi:hypothetical protein